MKTTKPMPMPMFGSNARFRILVLIREGLYYSEVREMQSRRNDVKSITTFSNKAVFVLGTLQHTGLLDLAPLA